MRTRQSTHESQLIVNKYFNLSSRLYEVNFKVIFLGNLKVRFPKKLTFFHTLLLPVEVINTTSKLGRALIWSPSTNGLMANVAPQ